MSESASPVSALWNAVETIVTAWAEVLTESLERNREPEWRYLSRDLTVCLGILNRIRETLDEGRP